MCDGNPRGSRKRARTLGAAVAAAMDEKVDVKENGRSRRITKLEAAAKQLANRAANGDQRAMQLVARLIEADDPPPRPAGADLHERGGRPRRLRDRPPPHPAPAMTAVAPPKFRPRPGPIALRSAAFGSRPAARVWVVPKLRCRPFTPGVNAADVLALRCF